MKIGCVTPGSANFKRAGPRTPSIYFSPESILYLVYGQIPAIGYLEL